MIFYFFVVIFIFLLFIYWIGFLSTRIYLLYQWSFHVFEDFVTIDEIWPFIRVKFNNPFQEKNKLQMKTKFNWKFSKFIGFN